MLRVVAALLLLLTSVSVEAQTRNPPAQSLGPNSTAYGAINCAPGRLCDLSQMTVTPQGGSATALPLLTKNYMSIDNSGVLRVLNGPTLGTYQNGQFTSQPYNIQLQGLGSTGDVSGTSALSGMTGAVNRVLADKLFERLSLLDFYTPSDGADYLPALNRAVAALPAYGGEIFVPRGLGCYPLSGSASIGDGSASGPSSKQNIWLVGSSRSSTGGQTGFGNDKGTCFAYNGTAKIGALLTFNGPMSMGLDGIALQGGYLGFTASPTVTTTSGSTSLTAISSMTNVVVGASVSGAGIPANTILLAVSGSTATMSAAATASGTTTATVLHNEATVDTALQLNHVFHSTVRNVGLKNARIGMKQDAYSTPNGFVAGSNDSNFENVWCENGAIAGGTCFDIGGDDATGILDVARNTYTNLVGTYAGDPGSMGVVLRYADNLTFRGGMMYSQRPWGMGKPVAYIPPHSNIGREQAYPAEITFQGTALIGSIYEDPRWKPRSNGNFTAGHWPLHAGDMLDPGNPGRGTLPSSGNQVGVDDRGVFFGWPQFRSWLNDGSGNPVAYDTASTLSRQTALAQITGTTSAITYATHKLPANAMRARNSKDYPSGTYPLSDAAQYAYDRVVSLKQSGNWFNNNTATTVRVQIRLGASVIFDSGSISLSASPFYGAWRLEGELSQSASNAQSFNGRLVLGQPGSGQGIALPVQADLINDTVSAIDMTTDQTLTAVVTPGTAGFVWNAERSIATVH